jgi:polar amino acid transport system ATP-binding protein/sulfate transport system ATP-binding protein
MNYKTGQRILTVENLSLSLAGKPILRDLSVQIDDVIQPNGPIRGQVVGFLAPSGMGKTQLFRCMAGLQRPSSGSIHINNEKKIVHRGEVGVLAQDYPLDETRTVLGNLTLAARLSKHSQQQALELASEKLHRFGLWNIRNQYPCELSGGQRQRVAYIQQILCSQHLLLMDEPFSGLDVMAKDEVAAQILEYADSDELNTIIITSHDIRTVCAVADLVWLLGNDHDTAGNSIPGARIQKTYNLKDLDLCWQPNITETTRFLEFTTMIEKQDFPRLK